MPGPRRKGSSRSGLELGERIATESFQRVTLAKRREMRESLPIYEEYAADRPRTRGDCIDSVRPCPWLSCRHHLAIDVKRDTGSLTINFPDAEEFVPPKHSCSLDIADEGGVSLDDVGELLNVTRERIRQIQNEALTKIVDNPGLLKEFVERFDERVKDRILTQVSHLRGMQDEEPEEDDKDEHVHMSLMTGDTMSFISEHPIADEVVSARIWRIYIEASIDKGWASLADKKFKRERHNDADDTDRGGEDAFHADDDQVRNAH